MWQDGMGCCHFLLCDAMCLRVSGKDLLSRAVSMEMFTEAICISWIRQICQGVAHMHKNNFIHLDLRVSDLFHVWISVCFRSFILNWKNVIKFQVTVCWHWIIAFDCSGREYVFPTIFQSFLIPHRVLSKAWSYTASTLIFTFFSLIGTFLCWYAMGRPVLNSGALWCSGIHRSWAPLIFASSLQQTKITGVVLTGRFSSLTAVVHSASYPPEKANRVAAYQW